MLNHADLLREAHEVSESAIALRRAIHRRPELGNREVETSALVARTLGELGWEVSRPVGTAVTALLRGGLPGKTVSLRADMDALPLTEATGLPFESETPGCMHACGHDMHTAGLLGAAMVLTRRRAALRGCVKLLFQPDEEGDGGARRMIEAGCLDDPRVDAVFGAHVDPGLPAGWVGLRYGKAYAASDMFSVTIHGAGCHGASPHQGVDAVAVGAQVVSALQQIVSRRVSPTDAAVVTVGSFHAGSAGNIVADRAELRGILRTLGAETRARVRGLFTETVEGVCAAMGARAEVRVTESYPGIVNWDDMVDLARAVAGRAVGPERVHLYDSPTMGTEDFGCFIQDVPGAFFKVGVGNPDIGATHPLHSPRFIADEAAMPVLIAMHAGLALAFLEGAAN